MKLLIVIALSLAIGFLLGQTVHGNKYNAGFQACQEQF